MQGPFDPHYAAGSEEPAEHIIFKSSQYEKNPRQAVGYGAVESRSYPVNRNRLLFIDIQKQLQHVLLLIISIYIDAHAYLYCISNSVN